MEKEETDSDFKLDGLPDDILASIFSTCVLENGAAILARVDKRFCSIMKTTKRIHEPTLEIERKYAALQREEQNFARLLSTKRYHEGDHLSAPTLLYGYPVDIWSCCEQVGNYGAEPLANLVLQDGRVSEYGCTLAPGCSLDEWNQVLLLKEAKKREILAFHRPCKQCGADDHTYLHCQGSSCANCDSFKNACYIPGNCPALLCSKCNIWGHKPVDCVTVVCSWCRQTFVEGHDVDDCSLRGQQNVCGLCYEKGHWHQACPLLPCKICDSREHLTEGCYNKSAVKAYKLKLREERARQDQERKAQALRAKEERIAAKEAKKAAATVPVAQVATFFKQDFWPAVATGSVAQVATFLERTKLEGDINLCEAALQIAKSNGHMELAFFLALRIVMERESLKMDNIGVAQQRVAELLQSGKSSSSSTSSVPEGGSAEEKATVLAAPSRAIQRENSSSSTTAGSETSSSTEISLGKSASVTNAKRRKEKEREPVKPRRVKPATSIVEGIDKMWPAAHSGSVAKISQFLDQGVSVDYCNNAGKSLLMIAAEKGHVDLVRFLVDRGADMQATNNAGLRAIDLTSDPEIQNILRVTAADTDIVPGSS